MTVQAADDSVSAAQRVELLDALCGFCVVRHSQGDNMKLRWIHVAAAVLFLTARPLVAQLTPAPDSATPDFSARIDAIFAEHDHADRPGCAVGVSMAGDIVFTKGYGMASLEHALPIAPSTAFDIGSVAKQFTALAVLLLDQRGRLSLAHDVRRYVPELPDYGPPITLQDLLQHTSGLRDYGTLELLAGRHVRTMPEFVELLAAQRALNFVPGTRHEYSHSDYPLLAFIVERAAGEPFGDFIEREVLQPLGMTASRVHDSRGTAVAGRAFAYAGSGDAYRVGFPRNEVVGGAKLYTSVEDMLRWERNFHEPIVGGRALIDALLARPRLVSGATIPYAYGLRISEYRGLPTVHRSGGGTFASEMLRFPEQRLAVVTLCNVTPSHPRYLSQAVAELYLAGRMQASAAKHVQEVATPQDELLRYAGVYRPVDTPWNILRIEAIDGALHEVFPDTSPPLARTGPGRYEAEGFSYAFTQQPEGGPLRLVLSLDAPVEVLERISEDELWRPDAAALEEFTGRFYSEDIDAAWTFVVIDGELVLRRRNVPDRVLVPVQADTFMQNLGTYERPLYVGLQFRRDTDAGVVSQLLVSTPSGEDAVSELRFHRVLRQVRR
jgi:CubicO group peptidase (beta-lactamase class C family)